MEKSIIKKIVTTSAGKTTGVLIYVFGVLVYSKTKTDAGDYYKYLKEVKSK